jgi:hypothetical protein
LKHHVYFVLLYIHGKVYLSSLDLLLFEQGKKQEKRHESLSSLEEKVRAVLYVLGLMPSSYHEVSAIFC